MQKYKSRKEVPEKYKWDLTEFFKNEEEFLKNKEDLKKRIPKLEDFKGCTKDAKKIYAFLKEEIDMNAQVMDLYAYSYLINDQEIGVKESIERKNGIINLITEFSKATSFFAPELLKLSQKEYENLFKTEPKLQEYKAELDRIYRDKEHVLSEEQESMISELTNAFDNFEDLSSNLLNKEHDYGKVKLEDGSMEQIRTNNYRHLLKNKNRDVRKKAYQSLNKKIEQYGGTSAGLLNSYVKGNLTTATLHNFKNAWEQKLFSINMSDKALQTLVKTAEENVNILQKFYQLKKKILGYDALYYYDTKTNLVDYDKEYTIEEAQELALKALNPLTKEYTSKVKKIFDNHYIDYCDYKGKCSGGYSMATLTKNSRILLSYTGNLDAISTIVHECGHNVHHQYLISANPLQYREQSTMVCEVMSLTNECLLSGYLAKNGKTKEERLAGIENLINVFISNFYGAIREGKIECDMYKVVESGGSITQELLDDLTKKSYKKYFGNTVKLDKYIKNSWILRSHYYMNFYLYSYAVCMSVAAYVSSKILSGDKEVLNKYFDFIKVGCDKWPQETFKVLGIDLEDKTVYENAIQFFESLIDQYETIYYSKGGKEGHGE